MDMKNNGGVAFPAAGGGASAINEGMTLRDYLAAKAAVGLLAHPKCSPVGPGYAKETGFVAREAYAIADAMIKERAK